MQIRGGSSKGIYFLATDLPASNSLKTKILLDAIGRDTSQIDGLGGGQSVTSKIAIVSKSKSTDADVDFLFVQVVVGKNAIDITPNCGNLLAGVGPFAIEAKLVSPISPQTLIRVNMLNTNRRCELTVQTHNGEVCYQGSRRIDGVPGTAAPIICNYMDVAGAVTGALFPTKNLKDDVDGINVTCVDNGMPVVLIRANDLNISGDEPPSELNNNKCLKDQLEKIQGFQKELNKLLNETGFLEAQKTAVLAKFHEVNKQTEDFKKELEEEYGPEVTFALAKPVVIVIPVFVPVCVKVAIADKDKESDNKSVLVIFIEAILVSFIQGAVPNNV